MEEIDLHTKVVGMASNLVESLVNPGMVGIRWVGSCDSLKLGTGGCISRRGIWRSKGKSTGNDLNWLISSW